MVPPLETGQSPPPFDLIVFDCDGVLVDSELISVSAVQPIFEAIDWIADYCDG